MIIYTAQKNNVYIHRVVHKYSKMRISRRFGNYAFSTLVIQNKQLHMWPHCAVYAPFMNKKTLPPKSSNVDLFFLISFVFREQFYRTTGLLIF